MARGFGLKQGKIFSDSGSNRVEPIKLSTAALDERCEKLEQLITNDVNSDSVIKLLLCSAALSSVMRFCTSSHATRYFRLASGTFCRPHIFIALGLFSLYTVKGLPDKCIAFQQYAENLLPCHTNVWRVKKLDVGLHFNGQHNLPYRNIMGAADYNGNAPHGLPNGPNQSAEVWQLLFGLSNHRMVPELSCHRPD